MVFFRERDRNTGRNSVGTVNGMVGPDDALKRLRDIGYQPEALRDVIQQRGSGTHYSRALAEIVFSGRPQDPTKIATELKKKDIKNNEY